jgi:hypothetical protein
MNVFPSTLYFYYGDFCVLSVRRFKLGTAKFGRNLALPSLKCQVSGKLGTAKFEMPSFAQTWHCQVWANLALPSFAETWHFQPKLGILGSNLAIRYTEYRIAESESEPI